MLEPLTLMTQHDDGFDLKQQTPALTVVIGGCNSIHAHNVVQVSGESLQAIANTLQLLPPEAIKELSGPLTDLVRAAGVAIGKIQG